MSRRPSSHTPNLKRSSTVQAGRTLACLGEPSAIDDLTSTRIPSIARSARSRRSVSANQQRLIPPQPEDPMGPSRAKGNVEHVSHIELPTLGLSAAMEEKENVAASIGIKDISTSDRTGSYYGKGCNDIQEDLRPPARAANNNTVIMTETRDRAASDSGRSNKTNPNLAIGSSTAAINVTAHRPETINSAFSPGIDTDNNSSAVAFGGMFELQTGAGALPGPSDLSRVTERTTTSEPKSNASYARGEAFKGQATPKFEVVRGHSMSSRQAYTPSRPFLLRNCFSGSTDPSNHTAQSASVSPSLQPSHQASSSRTVDELASRWISYTLSSALVEADQAAPVSEAALYSSSYKPVFPVRSASNPRISTYSSLADALKEIAASEQPKSPSPADSIEKMSEANRCDINDLDAVEDIWTNVFDRKTAEKIGTNLRQALSSALKGTTAKDVRSSAEINVQSALTEALRLYEGVDLTEIKSSADWVKILTTFILYPDTPESATRDTRNSSPLSAESSNGESITDSLESLSADSTSSPTGSTKDAYWSSIPPTPETGCMPQSTCGDQQTVLQRSAKNVEPTNGSPQSNNLPRTIVTDHPGLGHLPFASPTHLVESNVQPVPPFFSGDKNFWDYVQDSQYDLNHSAGATGSGKGKRKAMDQVEDVRSAKTAKR